MNNLVSAVRRIARDFVLGNPTPDPHAQVSLIYSDPGGAPTPRLFELARTAIAFAREEDLSDISQRMGAGPRWPDVWPGEHYKLLAGLVRAMAATRIVEIGTYEGLSALALAKHLPAGGTLVTFDVVPFERIDGCVLRREDLASGRIEQRVADLTQASVAATHRALFEDADLIFVDAAKDGRMERTFLDWFEGLSFRRAPIVVLDDIRVWNMLGIWSSIRRPRLDLTSFGHFSGTGVIDWSEAAPPS